MVHHSLTPLIAVCGKLHQRISLGSSALGAREQAMVHALTYAMWFGVWSGHEVKIRPVYDHAYDYYEDVTDTIASAYLRSHVATEVDKEALSPKPAKVAPTAKKKVSKRRGLDPDVAAFLGLDSPHEDEEETEAEKSAITVTVLKVEES